jgi:hypothetical protein
MLIAHFCWMISHTINFCWAWHRTIFVCEINLQPAVIQWHFMEIITNSDLINYQQSFVMVYSTIYVPLKYLQINPFLHIYAFLCICKHCRSRSASTSMPSDQDLHCLLLNLLDYFWPKSKQCIYPDQTAWMWQLIWIYTGRTQVKRSVYGGKG